MNDYNAVDGLGQNNIKDVSMATFTDEVITASNDTPVIVDFWAPWCEPCKKLGPSIENAVSSQGGKVKLAKINIDENPQLAQQLRVQSIPTVYAFFNGQPVDGFAGAIPDSEVKSFVSKVAELNKGAQEALKNIEDHLIKAEKLAVENKHGEALEIFSVILEQNPPENETARTLCGLGKCLIATGKTEEAEDIINNIDPAIQDNKYILSLKAAIKLTSEVTTSQPIEKLKENLNKNPKDLKTKYELSESLMASGDSSEAINELLDIIKIDKNWNEGAAKNKLLEIFDALGSDNPLTQEGRMRLSSLIFS
tara:strand:+ start:193 stop:1119 length:927 start_codon:yes stop_codon:yes gene_type:complete